MHAFTIFIQRPNDQASLLAKCCPHQSARFILRNQGLDLGQTTSPLNHSHFAHIHSASLNAAQEKGALLRRILSTHNTPPDAPRKPASAPALRASLPDLTAPPMAGSRRPGHVEHEKKTFFS
jgi:hypothetical protein